MRSTSRAASAWLRGYVTGTTRLLEKYSVRPSGDSRASASELGLLTSAPRWTGAAQLPSLARRTRNRSPPSAAGGRDDENTAYDSSGATAGSTSFHRGSLNA